MQADGLDVSGWPGPALEGAVRACAAKLLKVHRAAPTDVLGACFRKFAAARLGDASAVAPLPEGTLTAPPPRKAPKARPLAVVKRHLARLRREHAAAPVGAPAQ